MCPIQSGTCSSGRSVHEPVVDIPVTIPVLGSNSPDEPSKDVRHHLVKWRGRLRPPFDSHIWVDASSVGNRSGPDESPVDCSISYWNRSSRHGLDFTGQVRIIAW